MKKNCRFLFTVWFLCLAEMVFAHGNLDKKQPWQEYLENNPEVVAIKEFFHHETMFKTYHVVHITVQLTNDRYIEFDHIDFKGNGGGFRSNIREIGGYGFCSKVKDHNKEYSHGVFFIDLSSILGIKIQTISDVIDNYDLIVNFAKELARKEIILGYQKIGELWFSDDVTFVQKYPIYFKTSEYREAKILSFGNGYCPWIEGWEKYLPDDFWAENDIGNN